MGGFGGKGDPFMDFVGEDVALLCCVAIHSEPYSESFLGFVGFHLGDRKVVPIRVREDNAGVGVRGRGVCPAFLGPYVLYEPES